MGFPKGQKRDFEQLQRRRLKAARLFDKGCAPAEVARQCSVSCQSATRWYAAWRRGGSDALKKAPRAGRPSRLSQENIQELKSALQQSPTNHGFATELWTAQRVAKLIEERFGVKYHPDHVCRLLGQLGWSCQRPTTRAIQRDEAAIRRWKRSTWPTLKKKP
jgi:transposase